MSVEELICKLHMIFTGNVLNNSEETIIRKHTRKFEELGDLSLPLNIKNWHQFINRNNIQNQEIETIFDIMFPDREIKSNLQRLIEDSKNWVIKIIDIKQIKNDIHLFLEKPVIFKYVLRTVLINSTAYGTCFNMNKKYNILIDGDIKEDIIEMNLTELRLQLLRDVTLNLLRNVTVSDNSVCNIYLTQKSSDKKDNIVSCGPVLNENGIKDCKTTAEQLYDKRKLDMRMMAQHKYGVQVKPTSSWNEYFEKLGKGAVTIEMLSNKPHKGIKITLNNLTTAHKGASFIFYNCARLAALFREFDKRISNGTYPQMPELDSIDFSSLNQPEEWELLYGYVMQFPIVIKTCIKDVENGFINPHYLVTFISNMCSVFSVYYRRIRILTDPREHLFAIIHTRIYLLKAIQQVMHNALNILNIEPVTEM